MVSNIPAFFFRYLVNAIFMKPATQFYYEKDGQQIGPVSAEELKQLSVNRETLIWYEELSEWKKIDDLPELHYLLSVLSPPPLPVKKKRWISNSTNYSGNK